MDCFIQAGIHPTETDAGVCGCMCAMCVCALLARGYGDGYVCIVWLDR